MAPSQQRGPVRFASLFARRFWITAYAFLALGFWLPGDYTVCSPAIPYLLGGILYFSCLRVRMVEVTTAACDARLLLRIAGLSLVKLLLLPLAAYGVMLVCAPAWAPGVFLVTMMPAGLSGLAFADLYAGSRMAALAFTIITSVVCPLTIPLLLAWAIPGPSVGVGGLLVQRALYVAVLLIAPFILAQVTRWACPALIQRHFHRWGYGSIGCICVLIFISVAANRQHWATWSGTDFIMPLAMISLATAVSAIGAWPITLALSRPEAVSFACSTVYMNNGLAVALAVSFYQGDPHLLLPAILVQIPMTAGVALIGGYWSRRAIDQGPAQSTSAAVR